MKMYHSGFGYGMGTSWFLCTLIALVVFIDLVLLGVWLWQRIQRESRECCHKCPNHEKKQEN